MEERRDIEPELRTMVRRGIIRHLYKKNIITRAEAEKLLGEGRL